MHPYRFIDDIKTIFPLFGELLLILSFLYLIPATLVFVYPWEGQFIKYFLLPAAVLFITSIVIISFTKPPEHMTTRQSMLFATFSWLLVSILSIVPFVYINHMNPLDSFFETTSAWTGTGLTLLQNIDTAPRSLIFWRSLMQWVGGMGVIVLGLIILRYPGISKTLYQAEARNDIILPNAVNTAKILFKVYVFLTLLGTIILYGLGMSLFDALNYSMTGIGTGGMAPHSTSVAYYTSKFIHTAIIILMILGATNFTTIYSAIAKKNPKEFIHDKQFLTLILIPLLFFTVYYYPTYGKNLSRNAVIDTLFQEFSAISCTGFNTVDISSLPDAAKVALTFLMIIGGSTGSTAGAIKIIRFLLLLSAITWLIRKNMYPESVITQIKFNDKVIREEPILQALSYSLLYLAILSTGTIITMLYLNTSFVDALFENASAMGNVGLSVGITSPLTPAPIKILFIIEMLLGRLEIFTFLVAIASIFHK